MTTANHADARLERDAALAARLPRTLAGMAAGLIDGDRADTIAAWKMSLPDADAASADEILAAAAPALRLDQLARKAAALELKLNPEGVKARKEHAKATRQRVEVRREEAATPPSRPRARHRHRARRARPTRGPRRPDPQRRPRRRRPLTAIRTNVMTELLQGRNPLNLLTPRPSAHRPLRPVRRQSRTQTPGRGRDDAADSRAAGAGDPRTPTTPGPTTPATSDDPQRRLRRPVPGYAGPDGAPAWSPEEAENARHIEPDDPGERRGPLRPAQTAPPPANLNLIIPIGTLLGWSTTPAQAGSFGLLDPDETRALAAAASLHPRTRWSATLADPAGRAIAHGRARGQHPWDPSPPDPARNITTPTSPGTAATGTAAPAPLPNPQDEPSSNADQAARLRHLIQALNIIFDPIAQDTCDHRARREPLHPQPQTQGPDPRPHASPATPPAAAPRPSTPTSTTPCRTPRARPTSAT